MQVLGITPGIALVALAGWFNGVKGSGNIKDEVRDVGDFSGVQIGHGFRANITIGPRTSVKVSGDDNLVPLIKTQVQDGDLVIEPADRSQSLRPTAEITISITTPKLQRISASGGSSATSDGTTGARFRASGSGGSKVKVAVSSEQVSVNASGGSRVELAGKAKTLTAHLSGGASLRANDVPVESVEVHGSGGSRADVSASASLDASLSGGSKVRVSGDPPKKNVQKSSGSEVTFASR